MNRLPRLSLPATAAVLLAAAGPLAAQSVPDSWLVVGPRAASPLRIPQVGTLHADPSSMLVLPGRTAGILHVLEDLPRQRGGIPLQFLERGANGRLSLTSDLDLTPEVPAFSQGLTERECFDIAQNYVFEVGGTELAPQWNANLVSTRGVPLHRPDVRGVAYYEFSVRGGGFLVIATGEHDYPINHWNDVGDAPTVALRRRARRTPVRFYKVDTLCYVAEDANQDLVAQIGALPYKLSGVRGSVATQRPWRDWRELKSGFQASYRPLIAQLNQTARDAWQHRVAGGANGFGGWSSWTTYRAGRRGDQCDYGQHQVGGCWSGCGPVAWAMLVCWVDRQAHGGNAYWAGRTGCYRTGGLRSGSASAVAPSTMDSTIETIVEEIRSDCNTFCITGSGATYPWHMDEINRYLNGRTATNAVTHYNSVGIHESRLREYARNSIRDRDTPAIIGIGWLTHYPLAWKYSWRSKSTLFGTRYERRFYVNNGWGGSGNGWVNGSTWFAGEVYP